MPKRLSRAIRDGDHVASLYTVSGPVAKRERKSAAPRVANAVAAAVLAILAGVLVLSLLNSVCGEQVVDDAATFAGRAR